MRYLIVFVLIFAGCTANNEFQRETISLAGEWKFRIDSLDMGEKEEWFMLELDETVTLPGSMPENNKGEEVTVNTDWTGDIVDRSYFNDKRYEVYRQPGNIKIPFWLKPVKYYKGVAWYQHEAEIPENWIDKRVILSLERCHWESTVYVNDQKAGSGNALATPHRYDLTDLVVPGKNKITIRIDNRVIIPIGVNSHSISDHTQSNWNGITGSIELAATSKVYIDEIKVFPDIADESARVIVSVKNPGRIDFSGGLRLNAQTYGTSKERKFAGKNVTVVTSSEEQQSVIEYKIKNPELWSEFNPALYRMRVSLQENGNIIDQQAVDFGMREFRTNGTRFEINGQPVFLRGTTECCIFPLTGYPPSDIDSWQRVLQVCKDYGLNHLRFHSFCPPEAAFIAADRLGIYFHVESSSWANQGTSIGNGQAVDSFIYEEGDRIIREYGNHPSFCMMAYGNEPAGRNQNEFLGKLINYWKAKDLRRVYTSAAGWPVIPENDYNLIPDPRIQHWGEGLKSIINSEPPQTIFDFRDYISTYKIPTVGHEIGQWCVYPDFSEIEKYTGVLKPTNFEIFRETLSANNMGDQAEDFLKASGKLQVLCYKADIEASLRTPGYAGFQILQLHDFPGQGTALVGILNPFFESKGYIEPGEFRMFCNETVPLARMKKLIYSTNETFEAEIEIAHFGEKPLCNSSILCRIINFNEETVYEKVYVKDTLNIKNCIPVGNFSFTLEGIQKPQKMTFEVSLRDTEYKNKWDFWVYPSKQDIEQGNVFVTERIDKQTQEILGKGGSVLLLTKGNVAKEKGARVAIGFSSIFWNTAWTNNQPPHTLGIFCDPEHPVFKDFPTEYHSNWQWWDPVTNSQAMIINDLPPEIKPLIQPIDTWFENRRLALAFEAKAGGGKLMVCSIDLSEVSEERIVSKQLLRSMLNYMNSDLFDPEIYVDIAQVKALSGI